MKSPIEYVDKWESSHNTVVLGGDLGQDSEDYGRLGLIFTTGKNLLTER